MCGKLIDRLIGNTYNRRKYYRCCVRNFMEDIEDSDQKCLQGLLWWTLLFCFKWLQTYSSMQIQLFLIFFFFPSLLFLDAMIYVDLKKIGYDIRKIDGEINEINIFFLLKEKTEFTYYEKKSNMR